VVETVVCAIGRDRALPYFRNKEQALQAKACYVFPEDMHAGAAAGHAGPKWF
jgi:hypothetical protein